MALSYQNNFLHTNLNNSKKRKWNKVSHYAQKYCTNIMRKHIPMQTKVFRYIYAGNVLR